MGGALRDVAAAEMGRAVGAAAAAEKVLRVELRGAESSLDPAQATDVYSAALIQSIYETPLIYDYLARPVRLVPGVLASLPRSADDGRTWVLDIRPGLRFAPDPLFASSGRAVTAEDLRFSLQRLGDPALHSPYAFLLTEHIAHMQVRAALQLSITLRQAEPDFPRFLALTATSVVPAAIVRADGGNLDVHPVGSGPYRLVERVRGAHFTLLANPDYRARSWDFTSSDPDLQGLQARMHGRPVPAIQRVEVQVIEEPQSAWLTFRQGQLDLFWLQDVLAPVALTALPAGVRLDRIANPVLNYFVFNVRDRDFGGMQPAAIALRRAVFMAIDDRAYVHEVRADQAQLLAYPVPPGVPGEVAGYQGVLAFDPVAANALLDAFGFRRGSAGLRMRPDGRALVLRFNSRPDATGRAEEEFLRRALARIGIGVQAERMPVSEFLKAARACQLGFARHDWFADVPDGNDFFQLLSSGRIGATNYSCFQDPDWEQSWQRARAERDPTLQQAAYLRLARQAEVLGVWKPSHTSYRNVLVNPRVHGFHSHPFLWSVWQYLDVD